MERGVSDTGEREGEGRTRPLVIWESDWPLDRMSVATLTMS
jgi:hypothetical protein